VNNVVTAIATKIYFGTPTASVCPAAFVSCADLCVSATSAPITSLGVPVSRVTSYNSLSALCYRDSVGSFVATSAPTAPFTTFAAVRSYSSANGRTLLAAVGTCVQTYGCSVNTCLTACNSYTLFDVSTGLNDVSFTTYNNVINSEAKSLHA